MPLRSSDPDDEYFPNRKLSSVIPRLGARPAKKMNLSSSAACSLPSAIEDGGDDDVYKVKRILAEGGSDDERVFLIEWEGYLLEESTWE
jgi:hypothetical protein